MATRPRTTFQAKPLPVAALASRTDLEEIRIKAICETLHAVACNGGGDWFADDESLRGTAAALGVPYLLVWLAHGDSNILSIDDLDEWTAWRSQHRRGVATLKLARADKAA